MVYDEIYGFEAFSYVLEVIFKNFIILKWIFICCPIYQIFYITRHFIKKHKSKNVVADGNSELQDKS